jgi:hypothetical protein
VRSILFYVVLYFGVFLVLHTIGGLRRWWYGTIGALNAVILTFTPQLLERASSARAGGQVSGPGRSSA